MARKPRKPSHQDLQPVVTEYGMKRSKERLDREGFHNKVTSLTPDQIRDIWIRRGMELSFKPDQGTFCERLLLPQLTRAPFILYSDIRDPKSVKDSAPAPIPLARLLGISNIGGVLADAIFADGTKSAQSLASTSRELWQAVSSSTNIWDCIGGNFRRRGHNGVFVVVTPKYTVDDFLKRRNFDPLCLDSSNCMTPWYSQVMQREIDILMTVIMIHLRAGKTDPHWSRFYKETHPAPSFLERALDPVLVKSIRSLKGVNSIWERNQFVSRPGSQAFEPHYGHLAIKLMSLTNQIHTQRAAIKVLHFHKVPLLDRRVLASIVRGCPNVTMLGVYDCPLIHFGDVLCLLDLIHEINKGRRLADKRRPLLQAFDFAPHYEKGMGSMDSREATFGLLWNPRNRDPVLRGFFLIILKAFLKAICMKVQLLFSKSHAFVDFLYRVPNSALAVPCFLDALYRYNELGPTPSENARKQALYDLLKPLRLDFPLPKKLGQDWPDWYLRRMGKEMPFCSSCGYDMLDEFFTAAGLEQRSLQRVCAGCTLQRYLDFEPDHLKLKKKACLDVLFPAWNGKAFNQEASVPQHWRGVLSLRTVENIQPPGPPNIVILPSGEMQGVQYREPLIRDNKIHNDSLQDLTSLAELSTSNDGPQRLEIWAKFIDMCNHLDIYRQTVHLLAEQYPNGAKDLLPYQHTRMDGGYPDSVKETQIFRQQDHMAVAHTFQSAGRLEQELLKLGW